MRALDDEDASVPALSVTGVSKRFGNTHALRSVDLTVARASVHALLGRNGSGKSTLIKVLAGFHRADAGRVQVYGRQIDAVHSPRQAHAVGLRFVHQDLGLVPTLSVTENLALGATYLTGPAGGIPWRDQHARAAEELRRLGINLDPRRTVASLGPVEQTMVAVTRSLQGIDLHRSVLFLDEPTARLPRSEVDRLLGTVDALRAQGVAVVYVTHRLDEVFASADSVTILTDGRRVHSAPVERTSDAEVRRMIVGRRVGADAAAIAPAPPAPVDRRSAAPVLELSGLTGRRVRGVDLVVGAGEVVAVTGLVGSGRSELGRLVYGLQPRTAGTVRLDGRVVAPVTTRRMRRAGVGYSPQDRRESLLGGLDVGENLAVTSYAGLGGPAGLSRARIRRMANDVIARLSVRPADPDGPVEALSGGNQQKVALGKWIRRSLRLLVLDEPLQGIDVGAKEEIMLAIREQTQSQGLAVLWLESDIEEVAKYADRTVVMRDGRCRAELPAGASRDELLEAVYGRSAETAGAHAGGERVR